MIQPLRIGHYEVGEFVARDKHASVCRVVDPGDGRTLRAKLYAPTGGPDARLLSRWHEEFADEAGRLRRHGRDLVPIEASGRAGDLAWTVTGIPSGEFLEGVLGEQPISAHRARALLGGMAAALDRLHANGLVHRSLKPSNVIIADDGSVLFMDTLLLGRFAEAVIAGALTLDRVRCAAPEVVLGYRQRAASNQYSLAVLAYRSLTGCWPYAARNAIDYAYACVYQDAPAPGSRLSGIPPEVDAVIARALAKEPEDRYPTCTAFIDELGAALQEHGPAHQTDAAEPDPDEAAPVEWFEPPTKVLELVPEPSFEPPPPLREVRESEQLPDPTSPPAEVEEAAPLDLPARPSMRQRLRRLKEGILNLFGKLSVRAGDRRVPAHLMREAYLADWRGDAARSSNAEQDWSNPITPEWALTVQPTQPGWLRVDGRYAGPAPAEISIPGRAGERVLVELMRDGVAVATTELQLHPLMDRLWEPQET